MFDRITHDPNVLSGRATLRGLRISVASLPIVEYLFVWNGLGFLSLQAIASRDPVALAASAIVFAALFSMLGVLSGLVKVRT